MRIVQVHAQIPPATVNGMLGRHARPEDYGVLLTDSARVCRADGTTLCVYLRKEITQSAADLAYSFWHSLRSKTTSNRGTYSGAGKRPYTRRDGKLSKTVTTSPTRSIIAGSFDRYPRTPFCRQTSVSTQYPEQWAESQAMLREAAVAMHKYTPRQYAAQMEAANKTHPAYIIPGTPFTTVTVNNTVAGAYHRDSGDFKNGFGVMSVLRRGTYSGGLLVIPAYGVAVDMQDRDVILFDVHEVHGNTPIAGVGDPTLPENGGHERISIVHYFREKMIDCLSPAEELVRAKALGSLLGMEDV